MSEHAPVATAGPRSTAHADIDGRAVLELRVAELKQLFNAMDPAPFRERDLDPNADAYIVDWGRETRAGTAAGRAS